jgi:FkbM family methyltransferase
MNRLRPTFNLLELSMIVAGVAFVAFMVGRGTTLPVAPGADPELEQLGARYGAQRYSQYAEEWILRDFFGDRRNGVFVDVGAYDYRRFSNTYYLETVLGWSGVAIEPQVKFAEGYRAHRPRTIFVPKFVSDSSDGTATLHVPASRDNVASTDKSFSDLYAKNSEPLQVSTTTLDDLLDELQIRTFDFLTIDVELSEPAVLKGFSIDRFRPTLVCIESHPQVRQQILDYFATHGYTVVGKYLRADTVNLWFSPLPSTQ